MSRSSLALPGLACLALACGVEDPPTDCGDSSMSIVTFNGRTSQAEDEIRSCVDIHAASRPDASASAPGRDESFATSRPNAIPWTDVSFSEAVEACGRAGKLLCNREELRAIAPIAGLSGGGVRFDETSVEALSPTSDVESVPHRFDRLNPVDMVIRGDTGKPPFPESTGSVAFWTVSPERDDRYHDPKVPLLLGRLSGAHVAGGVLDTEPVVDADFRHPLVGFRCCVNAQLRAAFEALPHDPKRVRKEEPDVPIAEP